MTIVVWKDGVMAADSQAASEYGCIAPPETKVRKVGEYVIGIAGTAMALEPLFMWVRAGLKEPLPEKFGGKSYCALIIGFGRGLLIQDGGVQWIDNKDAHCIGGGAEIAYGALHMGATAEEAVQAAIACSIYCGGKVEAVRL